MVTIGQRDWCGIRFYMRPTDRPTSVARMMYKISGGTGQVELRHRTDGKLDLLYGSVLKGTSVVALTDAAKFYCIAVLEDRFNDQLRLYVDGVEQFTPISVPGMLTVNYLALTLGFYQTEAEQVEAIFDDVCLIAGDNEDGPAVPGQGKVLLMAPDNDGTYLQLSKNTGDLAWQHVEEVPYTATEYLYTTSDDEKKESLHLTQPVPASNNGINAVMPIVVECEPTGVSCTFTLGLRVGSTDYLPSVSAPIDHSGYQALAQLQEYCPTYAELATLQALLVVDNLGVGYVKVTQVAVMVDYAEGIPGPPVDLSPSDGAIALVPAPTFAGDYVQSGGAAMAYAHVEVWDSAKTIEVWDSGDIANTGTRWIVPKTGSGLTAGVTYEWRARCKDSNGSYGDWSSWQTLVIDSPPTTPTGCDPTSGETVTDTTPDLTWTHNDPDGHAQRFYQVELRRNDTGDLVSGYPKTPLGATDTFPYENQFLAADESLPTAKAYTKRGGGWGVWGYMGYAYALTGGKAVATLASGLADGKVRVLAEFVVGLGLAFRSVSITLGAEDFWFLKFIAADSYGGRLRLSRYDGSATEVVVATTSDLDLALGQYYWLMVELSGDQIKCYLDDVLVIGPVTNTENQTAQKHGLYAEATGYYQFDNLLVQATAGEASSDTAPTLTVGLTYKWKVRTHDGQGWGAWSDWNLFTVTAGLLASVTSPTEAEEKTGLPVTVQWSMSGGTAPQTQYRVMLYAADGSTLLEDSGWQSGSANSYALTYSGWLNLTTYKVKVGIRDSSTPTPLEAWSSLRTFSTDWTPPPAPGNVSASAVLTGNPHIHLSWDQSGESDFVRYEVWRRCGGETAYLRIAVITEKATTTYDDYLCTLTSTWEYVVKQVVIVNDEEVPSDPAAMVSAALTMLSAAYLHDTTDEAGVYVVLQLEPDRSFRHHLDRSVRFPWGSTKPVEVVGEAEWWTFQVSMTWLMEDDASRGVLSAMLVNGNTLCYRDGRGRKYFCRPDETGEADAWPAQFSESIPFVEIDFCEVV